MRGGTVCSGIGAPEVAAPWVDWRWCSEIEAFPSAVLKHHRPDVPNLGDMTKFQEWPDDPIDVLVGGTPCQSFSVAGLRRGMADPRGNLALTYLAIAARYRPRWLVWENVPGVLSSNGGRDFGSFLGGLGQLGYGFAYRVLDAQFVRTRGFPWAVPQRRRRVFVVGYSGDWRRAAAVLFDGESLSGNPPPRREAGTGVADFAVSRALTSSHTATGRLDPNETTFLPMHGQAAAFAHQGGGTQTTLGYDPRAGTAPTLQSHQTPAVAWALGSHAGAAEGEQTNQSHDSGGPVGLGVQEGVAYSLRAGRTQAAATPWAVRRLTPRECERLQGFPDGFTDIPWRNKPRAPDGPRYKALGNSMAVNVMEWITDGIRRVDAMQEAA